MLSTAVVIVCDDDGSRRASFVGLRIASEFHIQEICGSSQFKNASIKCFDLSGVNGMVISNHVVRIKLRS